MFVISLRTWAIVAVGVALLFTSFRATRCERSRDVLAASITTELSDNSGPLKNAPSSPAPVSPAPVSPVDDGASLDAACTATAAIVPARVSTAVRPATTADSSFIVQTLSPRSTVFALERPPRSC